MFKKLAIIASLLFISACSHFDGFVEHDKRPRYDLTQLVYFDDDGFPIQLSENLDEPTGKKWDYDWDRFQLALDRSHFYRAYTARLDAFCGEPYPSKMKVVTDAVRRALPEVVSDLVTTDETWLRYNRSHHPFPLPSPYIFPKLVRYAQEDPNVESEVRIRDLFRYLAQLDDASKIRYYKQGNPRYCGNFIQHPEAYVYFVRAMYKIYFPEDRIQKAKLLNKPYTPLNKAENTRFYYKKNNLPLNHADLTIYQKAWRHISVHTAQSRERSDSLGQALLDTFDLTVCNSHCGSVGNAVDAWLTEY